VDGVSDWNGSMLISIMQQHRLQTQFRRVYKKSPFLRVMFDSEGIHQAIYIVAEHRVIFHCLSLDPRNSALLLGSSRFRKRSFSSSCVRMCGCGAEDLPWETCGSVDACGTGEPEVDSPSSSSSESMVNSFGGSGTEIPSPYRTGRRAHGIFGYTIVHFLFFVMPPETGGTIQK